MSEQEYQGKELDLFAEAPNWKFYWGSIIRPFLGTDVLEVGAGIGTNGAVLCPGQMGRYVCLEPDPKLAERIDCSSGKEKPGRKKEVFVGTLRDLPAEERFDSILYIDVLEHIDNDKEELALAAAQLRRGGIFDCYVACPSGFIFEVRRGCRALSPV